MKKIYIFFLSIFLIFPCYAINNTEIQIQEMKRGNLYDYEETIFKFENSIFFVKLSSDYQKINIKYQSTNNTENFSLNCDSYVEELSIRKINENLYWFSAESLGFEQLFIWNLQNNTVYEPFFDMKKTVDINIIDYENQVIFGDTWNSDKGIMLEQKIELYLFSTAKQKHYKIAEKKGSGFNVKLLDGCKIEYSDQNGKLIKYDYSDWINSTVSYNSSNCEIFNQKFSINGSYPFKENSLIEKMIIENDNITFCYKNYLTDKKNLLLKYNIINDNGIQFIKFSENLPKEIYEFKSEENTDSKILFLFGLRNKNDIKYKTMFAYTKGYPFSYGTVTSTCFNELGSTFYDCSSFLKEKNKEYPVENLRNLAPDTPWVEAAEGYGIGEGFSVKRDKEPYLLIMNGYISYDKPYLYKQNGRIKKLSVKGLKTKKEIIVDVLDTPHPQTVNINDLSEKEDIRVTIEDVYPGTKYEDTCLHYLLAWDEEIIPYEY